MKKLLFLFMLTSSFCAIAQDKVIRVNNATVRNLIEQFTAQHTFPDAIKFVQDGQGRWVTSMENLQNIRYKGIRQDLRQFLIDNGVQTNITSLKEALETYGVIIDYVPPINTITIE